MFSHSFLCTRNNPYIMKYFKPFQWQYISKTIFLTSATYGLALTRLSFNVCWIDWCFHKFFITNRKLILWNLKEFILWTAANLTTGRTTSNPYIMLDWLDYLILSGGGDCPEYTMTGMLKGRTCYLYLLNILNVYWINFKRDDKS